MSIPAVHCEARKVAYRQTKDGLVVSFVVHPNDMPDALAVAPLGQRYMLALAAIGDDEKPIDGVPADILEHEYRKKEGLPSPASQRGKERYANSTQREQALVRAARLPDDERFRAWVASEKAGGGARRMYAVTEHEAADYIRHRCCEGGSRKLIAEDDECWRRFTELEMAYKMTTGLIAEVR